MVKCKHEWQIAGLEDRCDVPLDIRDMMDEYYEVAIRVCVKCGKKEEIKTWQ